MLLPTSNANCVLRPWRAEDQASLVHHANNRKVWRNSVTVTRHPTAVIL